MYSALSHLVRQTSDRCFCGKTLEDVVNRGPANMHHLQILSGTDLLYLRDTHPRMEGLRNATVWVLLVLCLRCLGSGGGGHFSLPIYLRTSTATRKGPTLLHLPFKVPFDFAPAEFTCHVHQQQTSRNAAC